MSFMLLWQPTLLFSKTLTISRLVYNQSIFSSEKFLLYLQKYASTAKAPLLINSCTVDTQFPHEFQAKADEILGGGKYAPGYVREYFEGCEHGFSVRGDLSDPKVKAGKEGAFEKSAKFFQKYL